MSIPALIAAVIPTSDPDVRTIAITAGRLRIRAHVPSATFPFALSHTGHQGELRLHDGDVATLEFEGRSIPLN